MGTAAKTTIGDYVGIVIVTLWETGTAGDGGLVVASGLESEWVINIES